MRKFWFLLVCAMGVFGLLSTDQSHAFDVSISGGVFQLTGTEPTTNGDGKPLTDLDRIEATYSIPALGLAAQGLVSVAASGATGGQPFSLEVTVANIDNFDGNIEFNVVACDNAKAGGRAPLDNCSVPATISKRVDLLAPGGIQ